eukprot:343882-Rhodomonas_salina.1
MWFAAKCALHPLVHVRGGWWEQRQEEVQRVERRAMGGGRVGSREAEGGEEGGEETREKDLQRARAREWLKSSSQSLNPSSS